jgi:hypothetical protein
MAVIEWPPTLRAEVLKVAVPLLNAAVPRRVAPSKKLTFPVGVPEPGADAATAAVIVTVAPTLEGFGEVPAVVVVAALFTVCVTVLLTADALKLASPL